MERKTEIDLGRFISDVYDFCLKTFILKYNIMEVENSNSLILIELGLRFVIIVIFANC